jgi:hypothetical protein
MSIYMMPDDDVGIIIRRSRRFLLRLPRHRWSQSPRCGAFLLVPANPKSAPDAADLSIGSCFQFADGLEALRRRLQRLVDIGWAMRQGQEHIVLGMKERAVA